MWVRLTPFKRFYVWYNGLEFKFFLIIIFIREKSWHKMEELEKYSDYLEDVFISASSGFLHFPPRDMSYLV